MAEPRRDRMGLLRVAVLTLSALAALSPPARAADPSKPADPAAGRAAVTALADRYVAEYERSFPIAFAFSGLPVKRHDGVDTNSLADIAGWQRMVREMAAELAAISPDGFAGEPEWVTWHFLDQAFRQNIATARCRPELWSVSSLGWQAGLAQVAAIQPVGTEDERAQALARWRAFAPWIGREIENLREGLKLGFAATEASTRSTLGQLDQLLAQPPAESPLMEPGKRAQAPAFEGEWRSVIEGSLWPAIARYRDFLRDEYLPRARKSPSLDAMPDGRACYRALIFATTTLEVDPDELFELAQQEVARERALALELGRKLYGERVTDWDSLGALIRSDPQERFASAEEIRAYTQRVIDRAAAAADRMVLTPPKGEVVLEPFPEFQQESAPGGQYVPAADDGSRPATYLYGNRAKDIYRTSLQYVIVHETLPGHHLQVQFLAEHGRKGNHPVARLLYFSGPGEGWATYAEEFARELGLYDSDRDYIGRQMGSITPWIVVDVGMQVKGWTMEQALEYARKARPLRSAEEVAEVVAFISSAPGFVIAYPLGGMKWREMRRRAEAALGPKFDVRAFHQALLEDGTLPFSALEAKLERWIAGRR